MNVEPEASPVTEQPQPEVEPKTEEPTAEQLAGKHLIDENRGYRRKNSDLRKKTDDLEAQLRSIQETELEKEGKHKEAAEFYKKKALELEDNLNIKTGKYAVKVITSQVRAAAAEMGCIDNEALVQLAPIADLKDDMDDDYNVKGEAVKSMLDMMQQKRPWLFKKTAPVIEDGKPTDVIPPSEGNSLKGKSVAELAAMLEKLDNHKQKRK